VHGAKDYQCARYQPLYYRKNKKNNPERLELKKFNPNLKESDCSQRNQVIDNGIFLTHHNHVMAKAAKTAIKTKDQKQPPRQRTGQKLLKLCVALKQVLIPLKRRSCTRIK
jgi:ribosomal protein L33